MVKRTIRCRDEAAERVVLTTKLAGPAIGIAASVARSHAGMEKAMISRVGTDHEIRASIVLTADVHMVHQLGALEVSPEDCFRYENVFTDIGSFLRSSWVTWN